MLPVIEIVRLEEDARYGTFGVLKLNKQVFCVTLEPPDRCNQVNRSSIPAQQYLLKRIRSPHFGNTFEVADVPGRSFVLLHPGNRVDDSEGCILLAEHFGKLYDDRGVLNSGKTFERFMQELAAHDVAHLTIHECF